MSVVMDGMLYIFGGHGSKQRFNDLHILDLSVWGWSTPTTTGTPPSPRQASAICLSGSQVSRALLPCTVKNWTMAQITINPVIQPKTPKHKE
jgi:hypothetical protein